MERLCPLIMYTIIGSKGHATSAVSAVLSLHPEAKNSLRICDAYDDYPNCNLRSIEVLGKKDIPGSSFPYFLAIGSNSERHELWRCLNLPLERYGNIIHRTSFVDPTAMLGVGIFIGAGAYIGPNVSIGNFSIVNTNSVVEHDSMVGTFVHVGPSACLCGQVTIGDFTLVGASATVLPSLTVPDRTTLGAGTVVVKSLHHAGRLYAGVPAQEK